MELEFFYYCQGVTIGNGWMNCVLYLQLEQKSIKMKDRKIERDAKQNNNKKIGDYNMTKNKHPLLLNSNDSVEQMRKFTKKKKNKNEYEQNQTKPKK